MDTLYITRNIGFTKLYLLPIICFGIFPVTYLILICFYLPFGTSSSQFPYVTQSNNWSPVNNIIAILLGSGTVLVALVVCVRYQQVSELAPLLPNAAAVTSSNNISMFCAFSTTVALFLFIYFFIYKITSVLTSIGEIFFFGLGTVYLWMQWSITRCLAALYYCKELDASRHYLAFISSLSFVIMCIARMASYSLFQGNNPMEWSWSDGGFFWHVIAEICYCISTAVMLVYILSFQRDFKHMQPHLIKDLLRTNLLLIQESPCGTVSTLDIISTISSNTLVRDVPELSLCEADKVNACQSSSASSTWT